MLHLKLAAHFEAETDPTAPDFAKLQQALGSVPLYHQWLTYQAKDAALVVNSYNTGTGKTKAALLRLLDLHQNFHREDIKKSNVLFIAPTNELLRQHEGDVVEFIKCNKLRHLVLRLDAQTIRDLGKEHLAAKFGRQSDRLHTMLQNPAEVLTDEDGYHPEGKRPYVLIINPDIFYYALYGLGNAHERRLLFSKFVENFGYIVVDEFHYYNAKQLANFLFFMTLSREWGYFKGGRQICLLTATPEDAIRRYLANLEVSTVYIEPSLEPAHLPKVAALAPVDLYLHNAEAAGTPGNSDNNGLVALAAKKRPEVEKWLASEQHGVFVSSALWKVNRLYSLYNGRSNPQIGRLTGAETSVSRATNKDKALIMATPTVDIGYNFGRAGKERQSIDFLFFDAATWDEFIQRLGRAGRVLGRTITNTPSVVETVIPDIVYQALKEVDGQKIERRDLNEKVKAALPARNGLYSYIHSGAIAEVFYPLYNYRNSLHPDDRDRAKKLYEAIREVFGAGSKLSYAQMEQKIKRYLAFEPKAQQARKELKERQPGGAVYLLRLANSAEPDDTYVQQVAEHEAGAEEFQELFQPIRQRNKMSEFMRETRQAFEDFYKTKARFNFRDNYQPPQVVAADRQHFLSDADEVTYSALHVLQNFEATWQPMKNPTANLGDISLSCEIVKPRSPRLNFYFYLNRTSEEVQEWEEQYCYQLAATNGFGLRADSGQIPAELNSIFEEDFQIFYAVPTASPGARALAGLSRVTALYINRLKVDFALVREKEYYIVMGSAALLIACDPKLTAAAAVARRQASRSRAIFDWEC